MRILVATYPFGEFNKNPIHLVESSGWEIVYNPMKRRLKNGEVDELLSGFDGVIAGTEAYTANAIGRHTGKLKVIARVGIGLDNVDIPAAAEAGTVVTYTPEAPSQAVAELTVAQILNLLRYTHQSDRSVREKAWNRLTGWLLNEVTIGILGLGRIGKRVAKLLQPFGCRILACDINPDMKFAKKYKIKIVGTDELFYSSNLVTVHIPLDDTNHHFVNRRLLSLMNTGALLINTSRGPVVDEAALTDALLQRHLGGAALDVFEKEPYEGPLTKLDNVIFTAHMGASTRQSRLDMEYQAAEDCLRVLRGEPAKQLAPGSIPVPGSMSTATVPSAHESALTK